MFLLLGSFKDILAHQLQTQHFLSLLTCEEDNLRELYSNLGKTRILLITVDLNDEKYILHLRYEITVYMTLLLKNRDVIFLCYYDNDKCYPNLLAGAYYLKMKVVNENHEVSEESLKMIVNLMSFLQENCSPRDNLSNSETISSSSSPRLCASSSNNSSSEKCYL
jgi:hypothetical protein